MSQLRRRIRVNFDGQDYEVTTNARDIANGQNRVKDPEKEAVTFSLALAHSALLRNKVDGIPLDFDKFLDAVDDMTDLEEETEPGPTPAAVSATQP